MILHGYTHSPFHNLKIFSKNIQIEKEKVKLVAKCKELTTTLHHHHMMKITSQTFQEKVFNIFLAVELHSLSYESEEIKM